MSKNLNSYFENVLKNHKDAYFLYWLKNDQTQIEDGRKCVDVGFYIHWFNVCKGNYDESEFTDLPLVGYAQFCTYSEDDNDCKKRDEIIDQINNRIPINKSYLLLYNDIPNYDGIPYKLYNLKFNLNTTLVTSWLLNKSNDIGFSFQVTYPNQKLLKYESVLSSRGVNINSLLNIKNETITDKDLKSTNIYDESSQIGHRKTLTIDSQFDGVAIFKLLAIYQTENDIKNINDVYNKLEVTSNDINIISESIPNIDLNNIPVGTKIGFSFDIVPKLTLIKNPETNNFGSVTTINEFDLNVTTTSVSNLLKESFVLPKVKNNDWIWLEWTEYFSKICELVSQRSPCERLKVGCVIVKDKRIVATGYNGFLPGGNHVSVVRDNHEQATVHAEQNCIADCAKRGVSVEGGTAFITHYPCINCFKILVSSGIKEIYYLQDYKNDEVIKVINTDINIVLEKI